MISKERILKSDKGSVSVIVLVIILLISIFGITMLTLSVVDLKSSYNLYWKEQSSSLSDHAIKEYRKRLTDVFYTEDSYYIDENLINNFDSTEELIEENGVLKAKIEYHEIDLLGLSDEDYNYTEESFSTGTSEGSLIYKNPPIDENFSSLNYTDVVQSGRGNVTTDGIFNKALNANEFYVVKSFLNSSGEFKKLEIQSYLPLTNVGYETALISKDKTQIESILSSNGYNLDNFSLKDEVAITTTWDDTLASPLIFLAISVKEDNVVHYFTFIPRIDSDLKYFDTIEVLTDIPNATKLKSVDIKSTFNNNMNSTSFMTNVFFENDLGENEIANYTVYYPVEDMIDLSTRVSLTKIDMGTTPEEQQNIRMFTSDLYWNKVFQAPELLLFVVKDNSDGIDTNFNGIINVFKMNAGIDDSFQQVGTLDLTPYFDIPYYDGPKEPYVNYLTTSVYWHEVVNDGYINLFFVAPNTEDVNGQDKMFYLETNVINFDINEVNEIKLSDYGITKAGRVSAASVNKDYTEVLSFIDQPIVEETTVTVEPPIGKNITITTYKDDGSITSVTEITMEVQIEVATLEYSSVRFVKKFEVTNLEIK